MSNYAPKPNNPERLEKIVKNTIRKGTDLNVLSRAAVQHGTLKKEEYIDTYLNYYNTTMKLRSFSKQKKVDGEHYTVPDSTACRQYSLFQSYTNMARDRGIDTKDWHFHPRQSYLTD